MTIATTSSPGGDPMEVEMEDVAQVFVPGNGYEWDETLLGMNWTEIDWRDNELLREVPWSRIQNETLVHLNVMFMEYDENHQSRKVSGEFNPAAKEKARRHPLEVLNIGTEAQSPLSFLTPNTSAPSNDPLGGNPVHLRQTQPGPAQSSSDFSPFSPPKQYRLPGFVYKDADNGFWTASFELELPVAVYRRGGLYAGRPHPEDNRWEDEPMETNNINHDIIASNTVDSFIDILSEKTDYVFVKRDSDEGTPLYDFKMENLHRLEHGLPMFEDVEMSDNEVSVSVPSEREPYPPVVENAAQSTVAMLAEYYFDNSSHAKNIRLASFEDIRVAVSETGIHDLTVDEREKAERRALELLELEAYKRRRDPRHVALPGMKPRYRAFSVYASDCTEINALLEKRDYENGPDDVEEPARLYGWQIIKIVSPVLRLEGWPAANIDKIIHDICKVVRANFRVHVDTPAVRTTTQIAISHTSGLDLMDMKKLASFLSINAVHEDLRVYNHWYRTIRNYRHVCGPLNRDSRLARMAQANYAAVGYDNDILKPIKENKNLRTLNQYALHFLPISKIMVQEKLASRIFHSTLWHYRTISSLVKALSPEDKRNKLELVIRARGEGFAVGGRSELDMDGSLSSEERRAHKINSVEADSERGVFLFRQMSGSLDPLNIASWLLVCAQITYFAKTSTPEQYKACLEKIMAGESVMDVIGINEMARKYLEDRYVTDGWLKTKTQTNGIVDWRNPFYPPMDE
ncbi:hypothetical protein F5Y11DRAFT_362470 [Daldinia sp. FL1419]|nr:hypothetical protein F5Y11DRAFT_362470 [Daldinia sp. FL1419]